MEPQNEHNVESSIAELADRCRQSLEACAQTEALMQYEWAENRLAEFKLWTAGTGAFASDKASLDARLSVNWETKSLIKNLLTLLTGCIQKCQMIVTSSPDGALPELYSREAQGTSTSIGNQGASDPIPRSFSPWSESSSTDSESEEGFNLHIPLPNTSALQSARAEVEHMIDYLSRLAVAVRKSGTTSRYQKADQLFKEEDHPDLFQHLVLVVLSQGSERGREQYDVDAKSLNAIQKRLIMSNLRRRNRFQYAQRHAQKLAFDASNPSNQSKALVPKNLALLRSKQSKIGLTGPDYTQASGEQPMPYDTEVRFPTAITATKASAVGNTIEAVPQQTPTLSQIARTNITSISAKVDYPRPPRLQEGLELFQCPCCCQTLPSMFRQRTQWKKHLAEDICPYTCFIENCICPESLYVNRTDWLRHVEKDHPRCWECLPCRKRGQLSVVFTSIEEFIQHTKLHHGDSITEDQHPTLISAAARPAPFDITRCPLCDQTGPADSDELLDHIAEHVHEFSLRSLPWPDESGTHAHKPNFFDDHHYFEDGSDGQSHNVSNSSMRDAEDVGSLPSNASLTEHGFSTDVDERSAETMEVEYSLRAGLWKSPGSRRGPSRDDYKIAIICVSQLELTAVRALFDEIHQDIKQHRSGINRYLANTNRYAGTNSYALGRLGTHYALATCSHLGYYDSTLASHIEKSFPNVKSYFAVGIGGGAPSERHDIRLGDVVVSTGIIQLDVESVESEMREHAGFVQYADPSILAAISSVQSDESLLYNALNGQIENIVSSEPGYHSPGEDRDTLFPAISKHKRRQATCEDCEGPHVQRKSRFPGPHIHHGFIGSVSRAIDYAGSRDHFGANMDVLSFEEHGVGGFMAARACLMIQGICDYADSHRNDKWHKYAAAVAAAYTKAVLLLSSDHEYTREIPQRQSQLLIAKKAKNRAERRARDHQG